MFLLNPDFLRTKTIHLIFEFILIFIFSISCVRTEATDVKQATGVLEFTVNGKDFIHYGFVEKDGWAISFNKFLVNIVDPEAYSLNEGKKVLLAGSHWVDLAAVKDKAVSLTLGKLESVPTGNYQALRYKIRRQSTGEFQGFSLVMIGKAQKAKERIDFTIKLDEELDYDSREGIVGDEIGGIVKPGSSASVEITLSIDHLFGDKSMAMDERINTESVGFEYFNQFTRQNSLNVSQTILKNQEKDQTGYLKLLKALWNFGNLGANQFKVSGKSSAADIILSNN